MYCVTRIDGCLSNIICNMYCVTSQEKYICMNNLHWKLYPQQRSRHSQVSYKNGRVAKVFILMTLLQRNHFLKYYFEECACLSIIIVKSCLPRPSAPGRAFLGYSGDLPPPEAKHPVPINRAAPLPAAMTEVIPPPSPVPFQLRAARHRSVARRIRAPI
jgi:hypothetical protein